MSSRCCSAPFATGRIILPPGTSCGKSAAGTSGAAAAFTKRAEAWKFKRDLKATLNYTVAKVQKLNKPGCTYNGQWIVVVEHAAIPDGAPDRFFGSIMQADVKLQSVYRAVKNA